jgi:hypothetical protein
MLDLLEFVVRMIIAAREYRESNVAAEQRLRGLYVARLARHLGAREGIRRSPASASG